MHAKYINKLRIVWTTHPGRYQNLFVNYLDLKNTKYQNIGEKQFNIKQPNIAKCNLYGPACLLHKRTDNCREQ